MFDSKYELLVLGGSVVILISFLLLPWVAVTPTSYLDPTLQKALDLVAGALQRFGPPPIPTILSTLEVITQLQGWKLVFVVPWPSLGFRGLIASPVILAALSLLWLGLKRLWRPAEVEALVALVLGGLAALFVVALVITMPAIERLGIGGFLTGLSVALFGIRLGVGYWGTLIGLLLLAIGEFLAAFDSGGSRKTPSRRW